MSKLNLIAIVAIVAAVSLIVGMAAPVFAQGNSTNSTMKASFQAAGGAANSTNPLGNAANVTANNATK
ncbi:MAG TPA: hypothetical protein VIY08_08285 [Candidatus Nitrosocosmicus sp.]